LQLRTERQRFAPYGLYGGQPGTAQEAIYNPDTENRHIGKTTMDIKKGDVLRLITSGAGGWSNPLERAPEMVLEDVHNGKVSVKRAFEVYGVVIDEAAMVIDIANTQERRRALKKARGEG
jgi:N-methylhydantoinase B